MVVESRKLSSVIFSLRFYVFWCGWFRMTIVEVRITIIILELGLTGPTTVSTELPLTAATTDPANVPTTLPETIGGLSFIVYKKNLRYTKKMKFALFTNKTIKQEKNYSVFI